MIEPTNAPEPLERVAEPAVMSAEAFIQEVLSLLDVAPEDPADLDASLYDDWALDSLEAFQLIIITESLAEAVVPPPQIPELLTPRDTYGYYLALRADPTVR